MFPLVMPKAVSIWAYEESGVHSLAAAIVKERYHKEAFTAALRILGEGHLSLSKCLFVTNKHVDLKDFKQTFITILERIDIGTDLHVFSNISQDTLDYTGPKVNSGSKMILLGIGEEKNSLIPTFKGKLKNKIFHTPTVFCPGVLVISGPKYKRGDKVLEALLKENSIHEFLFVFLVDDAKDACKSDHDFIWNIFTRFEPAGDVYGNYTVIRNHISYQNPILVDCRMKDWYPPVLEPDSQIVKRVDERFGKLIVSSQNIRLGVYSG
jgi:3-polyprenyl-4-hydroxybenzoate decarboxylase